MKRNKNIIIRVNETEREQLFQEAENLNVTLSEYVRNIKTYKAK